MDGNKNRVLSCSLVIITVIIIVGIFGFVSYSLGSLMLMPDPALPQFQVESASVSPLNLTAAGSQISAATWKFSLRGKNPNWYSAVLYQLSQAVVRYGGYDAPLASTGLTLEPVQQGPRAHPISVLVRVEAAPANFSEDTSRDLGADMSRGSVSIRLVAAGPVKITDGSESDSFSMTVNCEGVNIGFHNETSAWTLLHAPKACNVY